MEALVRKSDTLSCGNIGNQNLAFPIPGWLQNIASFKATEVE